MILIIFVILIAIIMVIFFFRKKKTSVDLHCTVAEQWRVMAGGGRREEESGYHSVLRSVKVVAMIGGGWRRVVPVEVVKERHDFRVIKKERKMEWVQL